MKFLKFCFLMISLLWMVSCSEDASILDPTIDTEAVSTTRSNAVDPDVDSEGESSESDEAESEGCDDLDEDMEMGECFAIVYPVVLVLPDATSVSVSSDEELDAAIDQFFADNPESEEYPTFEYPISVTLTDESTLQIASDEELEALFDECEGSET